MRLQENKEKSEDTRTLERVSSRQRRSYGRAYLDDLHVYGDISVSTNCACMRYSRSDNM